MRITRTRSKEALAKRLMYNPDDCGKLAWSKAAGQYMPPSKPKRIDPNSPEGRAIAAKYART